MYKSKDLRYPYKWENRRVMIHDAVWFIPERVEDYHSFSFPGWSDPSFFGNDHPVNIEYCSGNGDWIFERAVKYPEENWVAVEIKFERVSKIWRKIKNHSLKNLFVICGEGFLTTEKYFLNDSIKDVYVNFPDPWPKAKHSKHRIIQERFLNEMARILRFGGGVTLVTDDHPFSSWSINHFDKHSSFSSLYEDPFYVTDHPDYGYSWFQELWKSQGKVIRYHKFIKSPVAT